MKGWSEGYWDQKQDGKIEGPGPLALMSLMVLEFCQDPIGLPGPGFSRFLQIINGLAGTFDVGAADVRG